MPTLIYDNTLDGFLTAIFQCYERRLELPIIVSKDKFQKNLFEDNIQIITNENKASRVWQGLKKKCSRQELDRLYYTFLSENEERERVLYESIKYIFANENVGSDFTHPAILQTSKYAKSVSRERHRMKAFVRFKLTNNNIYFANVEPDFNVLPLIINHFKNRYADQEWIIYDLKRSYGFHYNLEKVELIHLEFDENFRPEQTSNQFFAEEELQFQELWKNYFISTNIEERKNTKLHIQHVPRRYWKYLSEKQP